MRARTLAIVLFAVGAAAIAVGLGVELQVRARLEGGGLAALRRGLAPLFGRAAAIAAWRQAALACVVAGPALVIVAYLLWSAPTRSDDER